MEGRGGGKLDGTADEDEEASPRKQTRNNSGGLKPKPNHRPGSCGEQ